MENDDKISEKLKVPMCMDDGSFCFCVAEEEGNEMGKRNTVKKKKVKIPAILAEKFSP